MNIFIFPLKDLRSMVEKLSEFLETDLDATAIDAIVDHCTFDNMKSNKMVNREKLPISDLFDMSKSKFMRKGMFILLLFLLKIIIT